MVSFVSSASVQGRLGSKEDAVSINNLVHRVYDQEKYLQDYFTRVDTTFRQVGYSSAATVAVVQNNRLTIGHVGDPSAVGSAVVFICDPDNDIVEANILTRLCETGSPVDDLQADACGFDGRCEASANAEFKIESHDIRDFTKGGKRAFLVISSDGLGKSVSLQQQDGLIKHAIHNGLAHKIADILVRAAERAGNVDHISVIATELNPMTSLLAGVFDGRCGDDLSGRLADELIRFSHVAQAPHLSAVRKKRESMASPRNMARNMARNMGWLHGILSSMFRSRAGGTAAHPMPRRTTMTKDQAEHVIASTGVWVGAHTKDGKPVMRISTDDLSVHQLSDLCEAMHVVGIPPHEWFSKTMGHTLRVEGGRDVHKLIMVLARAGALADHDLASLPPKAVSGWSRHVPTNADDDWHARSDAA